MVFAITRENDKKKNKENRIVFVVVLLKIVSLKGHSLTGTLKMHIKHPTTTTKFNEKSSQFEIETIKKKIIKK